MACTSGAWWWIGGPPGADESGTGCVQAQSPCISCQPGIGWWHSSAQVKPRGEWTRPSHTSHRPSKIHYLPASPRAPAPTVSSLKVRGPPAACCRAPPLRPPPLPMLGHMAGPPRLGRGCKLSPAVLRASRCCRRPEAGRRPLPPSQQASRRDQGATGRAQPPDAAAPHQRQTPQLPAAAPIVRPSPPLSPSPSQFCPLQAPARSPARFPPDGPCKPSLPWAS